MRRLQGCIDRGLQAVAAEQEPIKGHVEELKRIEATLDPSKGSSKQRKRRFQRLRRQLHKSEDPVRVQPTAGLTALAGRAFALDRPIGGYNLCYLRPEATLGAVTRDEYNSNTSTRRRCRRWRTPTSVMFSECRRTISSSGRSRHI